jgi:hypothetical protein
METHSLNLALTLIILMGVLSFPLRGLVSFVAKSIVRVGRALIRQPVQHFPKAN